MHEYYAFMRMRQVEAFRAVMASGGVTAASTMLNLSQPSVSRLIADLERSVGFSLFERRGGRMHPTAQAWPLYEAVQRAFVGLEQIDQAARRIRAEPAGVVRIAALPALAAAVLPAAIEAFLARHGEVRVTVESLGQRQIEERVFLGQADLGLCVETPVRRGVRARSLARADYVCALPAGHRLTSQARVHVRDLEGERFIGPLHAADALWNDIDQALEVHGVTVDRRLECQQSQPVYAMVAQGLGLAVVEPFSAPMFEGLGVATRPLDPAIGVNFVVLEPEAGAAGNPFDALSAAIEATAATLLEGHRPISVGPGTDPG